MVIESKVRERDNVLDFWRGVSILMVLMHHFFYFRWTYIKDIARGSTHQNIFFQIPANLLIEFSERSGAFGVRFFFVISGFIITKLLLDEEARTGSVSIKSFYTRRIFRIIPPYIFYLLGVFLFGWLGFIRTSTTDIVSAMGFLCNTSLANCGWSTIHTWSLAVEEQFYIFWPLIFFTVPARFRSYFLSTTFIGLIILSWFGFMTTHGWIDVPLAFACITIGALFATQQSFNSFVRRKGLALTVAVAAVTLLMSHVPSLYSIAHAIYRAIIPFGLLSVITFSYRLHRLQSSMIFYLITQIGIVSYSLYLWQELFLGEHDFYVATSFLSWPWLMFAFAIFSYIAVEKPVTRWARTRQKQMR